jgi:hypothetical protein
MSVAPETQEAGRKTTNACAFAGYTKLMSDASTSGCLLADGQHVVVTLTTFSCPCLGCCRDTRKPRQHVKCLEIWFLQILDYQFISTTAPMQKWLSASPSKHDTGIIFVQDGSRDVHPHRLVAMKISADSYLAKLLQWLLHIV